MVECRWWADDWVYALALDGTDLYASGFFTKAGGTPAAGIAKWSGTTWSPLGTGISGGTALSLAVWNHMVLATGNFTGAGGGSAARFAVWNGTLWSPAGDGLSSTGYRVQSGSTNVYVGGFFLNAGGIPVNGIASWDGTNWSSIGAAAQINGPSSVVRALDGDGTNLFVGGLFSYAGQTPATNIARFDGTNWTRSGVA